MAGGQLALCAVKSPGVSPTEREELMADKLVTIRAYENPAEAHAAKNCLESEGIIALVADEAVGNWLGYMGSAIGGIKLQVSETEAERAQAILDSQVADDSEAAGPWRCTRCQEIVDGGFEICWSCNGERSEFQDPGFTPDEALGESSAREADHDEGIPNAAPLAGEDALIDGRPNPYYAGSLPASRQANTGVSALAASEEVEAMATRAWRAAIIGIFVCPMFLLVNIYSVWLLVKVSFEPGELSPGGVWKCRVAWIINWIAVFIMLTVLTLSMRG
jgi:hypothetical protein